MTVKYSDCKYLGFDPASGHYIVQEQLYPEARGWLEHEFPTAEKALAWLDKLPRTDQKR